MSASTLVHHLSQNHRRRLGCDQDVESLGSSSGTHRLKLRRLQSAHQDEGVWVCKNCGFRYDTPHPRARVRREHKKICPGRSNLRLAEKDEAVSGDLHRAISEYDRPGLPVRAQDVAAGTTTTGSMPIFIGGTDEQEGSAGKEEPVEERARPGEADEAIEEPVPVRPWDRSSADIDESEKIDEGTEVQSIIAEEVPSGSVSQRSESVDETVQSGTDEDGQSPASESVKEAATASANKADQLPVGTVVKRAEESGKHEPPEELGAGGVLEEEEGLQRGGSRGTSVTDEYDNDSEWYEQYPRDNEILSSEDGDEAKQQSGQSEEEELTDAERPTTGKDETAPPEEQTGIRRDPAPSGISEITPAEDVRDDTTTSSTGIHRREEFDVILMLRKQNVFDIFCPICGSDITRRIVIRKKKRSFVSKEGLRRRQTSSQQSTSGGEKRLEVGKNAQSPASGSDDEDESWLERCLSYFYSRFCPRDANAGST